MRRAIIAIVAFLLAVALVLYYLTMRRMVPASALPAHKPDLANGKYMLIAAGCAAAA